MAVDGPSLKPARSSFPRRGSLVLGLLGLGLAGWEAVMGDIASALVVAGITVVGLVLAFWRRTFDESRSVPYTEGPSFRLYVMIVGLAFSGVAVWMVVEFFEYRRRGLAFHATGSLLAGASAAFMGILAMALTVAIQRVISGSAGRFTHWLYRPNRPREGYPRIVSWLGVLLAIVMAVLFVGILVEDGIVK